jgi:hypothetical protein
MNDYVKIIGYNIVMRTENVLDLFSVSYNKMSGVLASI